MAPGIRCVHDLPDLDRLCGHVIGDLIDVVRFSRRAGFQVMLGASQAAFLGATTAVPVTVPVTYDQYVASLAHVVSYWKFENDGTDERGAALAMISGRAEYDVPTIVNLDTIAEGAPVDGLCIAWPGAAGAYAQAAHSAAHKTAEGTIVVTFQHDALSVKSTLVAADRSDGGTSAGPGGLSIEVQTDGSPRCFLRRQSDGAVVELVGQSGDVRLNRAYTLIFKWGRGGLSMALWNDTGNPVRTVTNPLEDGVTGTSPIRFGAWHTDVGRHDGPYGRVVWLNRRIADAEETSLARPRTISRVGGYTPFPFVNTMNPPISHAGCSSRPAFNASNPRSASFIDPMSGLEVFRVTGNHGSNVLLNGTTDSGLDFPKVLKPENAPRCQRTWNADGTLLSLPESKARSGDPANPCRAVIIDADGSHGASQPWQIIRASGSGGGFGDVPATGWFWDWNNPLRAYACHVDGMYEWWPIGGQGHSVGEKNLLFNWPSGFSDWEAPRGGRAQSSHDGLIYFAPVRRNSDGFWGGIRVNLANGTFGPFVPNPAFTGQSGLANDDDDRGVMSTGALGTMGFFAFQDDHTLDIHFLNMITGAHGVFVNEAAVHNDYVHVDGREYIFGPRSGSWRLIDAITGEITPKADLTSGVVHASCRNFQDTFENHGATGGSTSGVRYGMCCNSTPGSAAGVRGVRLGANDFNVVRYICNHRSVRIDNVSEVHPSPSPGFKYVAFNSNWRLPGIETDDSHVNTYVCLIPDAWRSPNNDGS